MSSFSALKHSTIVMLGVLIFLARAIYAQDNPNSPISLPAPVTGTNLDSCMSQLNKQQGGWCEIKRPGKHPSISSVWPENLDKKTRMITGPKSILIAWNGAAFDKESKVFYFIGGGHADYGGNEVYSFDLIAGKWERLTDPSPLDHIYIRETKKDNQPVTQYCWIPDIKSAPGIAHTYDGIQFSQTTKTFFMAIYGAANGGCFTPNDQEIKTLSHLVLGDRSVTAGLYEFNPSKYQTHHGLAPLQWRRHELPFSPSYPRMVELPDGSMLIGKKNNLFEFDPINAEVGRRVLSEADYGDGLAEYHPNGSLLLISDRALRIYELTNGFKETYTTPKKNGKSIAINKDGLIFTWNGRNQILIFDPRAKQPGWRLFDWGNNGPLQGDNRVYSKWQYLENEDVFIGISSHETGVWVYKHFSP